MAEHADPDDQPMKRSASPDDSPHGEGGDQAAPSPDELVEAVDIDEYPPHTDPSQDGEHPDDSTQNMVPRRWIHLRYGGSRVRLATIAGSALVVVLACSVTYLGYHYRQDQHHTRDRNLFLASGRQAALDLTTIDYTHVDADLARILDSATGRFHDDFQTRSQPFIDVVKQAQSKSQGTVTEAALESESGDHAQVLVSVSVATSNAGAQQQNPRSWRMRISLQNVGGSAKVSDVQFVT